MEITLTPEREAAIIAQHGSLDIIQRYADNEGDDCIKALSAAERKEAIKVIDALPDAELVALAETVRTAKAEPAGEIKE